MKKEIILIVSLCLFWIGISAQNHAQPLKFYADEKHPIVLNATNDTLLHPFSGGMNNPMFGKMDVNGDGVEDFVVFDHIDSTLEVFLNIDGKAKYKHAPYYKSFFPTLVSWFYMFDYNKDGKKDIFAYSRAWGGGIEVYKNVTDTLGFPRFKKIRGIINTKANILQGAYNMYMDRASMGNFVDIDNDGDMDYIGLDLSGYCLYLYKCRDADLYGTNYEKWDSLTYELTDASFGYVMAAGTGGNYADSNIHPPILSMWCGGYPQIKLTKKHAGGAMMLADFDGDGDKELLYSDINGSGFSLLTNGKAQRPSSSYFKGIDTMISIDTFYLKKKFPYFPSSYYEDVDNDGKRDLLISPLVTNNSISKKSVYYYKNLFRDDNPIFNLQTSSFLQGEMIDEGYGAIPVFFDTDNDGKPNMLLIGTRGSLEDADFGTEKLVKYDVVGFEGSKPVLQRTDANFLSLASANYWGLSPAKGDLDNDGYKDLLIGLANGKMKFYRFNPSKNNFELTASPSFDTIDAGNYSHPAIIDIDLDGLPDLVLGSSDGHLIYYRNLGYKTGSNGVKYPEYVLVNDLLGDVDLFDVNSYWGGSGMPVVTDVNKNGILDLVCGTENNQIRVFLDIQGKQNEKWISSNTMFYNDKAQSYYPLNLGKLTAVTFAEMNGDTLEDMIVGNDRGGLYYFSNYTTYLTTTDVARNNIAKVDIFPNPANSFVDIQSDVLIQQVSLCDITGKQIIPESTSNSYHKRVDIQTLPNGLYLLKVTANQQQTTKKLVIWR